MAKTWTFPVRGMTCAACAAHVEGALARLPGVREVHVNLATEKATLVVEGEVSWAEVIRAVREAGYEVPTETKVLAVSPTTPGLRR